jgi:GTPase SAR1 family protein
MVGAGGVAETSLVNKRSTSGFSTQSTPQVGPAYIRSIVQLEIHSVALNIWDTTGHEKFHSLFPRQMRNAHGLIFVFETHNLRCNP